MEKMSIDQSLFFWAGFTEGQGEGFPRHFIVEQNCTSTFPQEINNGNHKNIVIEFPRPEAPHADLFTVPLTLTIDTVGRGQNFKLRVMLENGNHVIDDFESWTNYGVIGSAPVTIVLPSNTSSDTSTQTYQLNIEGEGNDQDNWGVFDWLQLEAPGGVLWTIGNNDNGCSEFDNCGFAWECNPPPDRPYNWLGNRNAAWNMACNWYSSLVPDSSHNVTIPTCALVWPEVSGLAYCNTLTIESGASLTVADGGALNIN